MDLTENGTWYIGSFGGEKSQRNIMIKKIANISFPSLNLYFSINIIFMFMSINFLLNKAWHKNSI